jgi:hypothetical protein
MLRKGQPARYPHGIMLRRQQDDTLAWWDELR